MAESDLHPHREVQTPPDHELTGMETFFDNLFNHHMVLPQTPDGLSPSQAVDDHEASRNDPESNQA